MSKTPYKLEGEMLLCCNCDVFCPCVVSLGKARPTFGYCQAWAAVNIDKGFVGDLDLSGLKVALMLDIPGRMSEGNWKAALYVDEKADEAAVDAITDIFTGKLGGAPTVMGILVGEFIGVKQVPISFVQKDDGWKVDIPKIIDGEAGPIRSKNGADPVVIANTQYWIGKDVAVYQSKKNKFRDFGRTWDFTGQSAEFVKLDWSNT